MRIGYAVAIAALLAAGPAFADVTFRAGDNDSTRHEMRADQDRAAGRQEMNDARQRADMGDYRGAAHEQAEAHRDWRDAHHQDHDSDRDSGGLNVQVR